MKRLIACLLTVIMLVSLVGCSGMTSQKTDTDIFNGQFGSVPLPNKVELSPLTYTAPSATNKTLTIGGVDISNFKIVYSENPMKATYDTSPYNKVVVQDTEYDKQTAENLSNLIYQNFGVKLDVVKDTDVAATTYEINIGNTNRNLKSTVSSYLTTDKSYVIKESSGKLIICGTSYGATWQAAEAFIDYCLGLGTNTVAIGSGFVKSGEANMLVVGCIGDSLTKGSGSSQGNSQGNISTSNDSHRRNIASYPAALQRMAWKQMVVYNYGLGSRTMADNFMWDDANDGTLNTDKAADYSWRACEFYDQCMANAANIDLVFLMLGTNDANSGRAKEAGYNYDDAHEKAFIQGCTNIVNDLKAKNSDVRIVMMNCPISYRSDVESYAANYIRGYQTKAAAQNGLTLLDMYTFTKDNLHKDSFPDTLHPNDEGYTIFAKGIYTMANPIIEEMLGEDAQDISTGYVTHAFIGTKPDGAPSYPVYATLAEAKTALGLGRNNISWSYVLYVTEDITETANLGTLRANVTIEAYKPSTTLSSNPTIKLNVHGDTSNWMLPNTANCHVTFKNVNVEVLEGGALYGDANSPRNILDLRDGAALTLDNVILTTYTTSGYAIALRSATTNTVNFKNEVQFLKKNADGTTVPCDKMWVIDNSTNHVINLDGAKINTTTKNIFDLSSSATVTVNVKNGSELKVSTGKIFNNTGNGTFNINVSGNSLLEATTDGGVIFDARGTNAVMNINVDGATIKSKSGQTFINQQVTSNGVEVSKNTTFNISVKNASITTTSGVVMRSLSIGGTMKAYFENTTFTSSAFFMNNNKANAHVEITFVGCTMNMGSNTFVVNSGATSYVKVIIKDSTVKSTAATFISNTGAGSEIIVGIEDLTGTKALSGSTNFFKNTADSANISINISNSDITSSGNVIYSNGTNATLLIEIFGGSELTSTAASVIYNDVVIAGADIFLVDSTLEAAGDYVVGNKNTATADTKYDIYLYVDDSVLKITKAAGKAIYNYAAYATMKVDVLSTKDENGEWVTQILAGDGTGAANAIYNDNSNSVMLLNVWGGHIETNGNHTAVLFRTKGSIANIYDGTIIADSTSAQSTSMFAIQAQDSTVNIYGGHIENKTTQTATFTIRHNNGTHGTKLGAVNVYGGTIKAGNAACIGAGISSKDGQVNIYGGTFIKTGAATTYGVLGHYNTSGNYDKYYYIYGGTFITKDSADPQAYRYADSDDMSTVKNCTGALNRAYDSVRMLTITEATAAAYGIDWAYDDYADVCVITPKGTDLKQDMFGKIGYQVRSDATVDSESTDIRVLVEVDASIVNNAAYDNIGFSISVANGNPTANTNLNVSSELLKQPIVYSCVKSGSGKYYASEGYYLAVLEISNIPNSSFDTNIYVRPYLMGADGTMYYGRTASVKVLPLD